MSFSLQTELDDEVRAERDFVLDSVIRRAVDFLSVVARVDSVVPGAADRQADPVHNPPRPASLHGQEILAKLKSVVVVQIAPVKTAVKVHHSDGKRVAD